MRISIKTTEAIFPMPVLMIATYNDDGSVNVMNAAWGTLINSNIVALNLVETHRTVQNIKKRKAFTVSIADVTHVAQADYFGIVSGNDVPDKFKRSGLTASKSPKIDAPIILEFPLCFECEFIEYQSGPYGVGVIGKIINTTADEKIIKNGVVDMSLAEAIAFDPYTHGYYKVTTRIGNAFSEGKKIK